MTNLKPFKFEPYLKSVLWGGEKIAKYKGIVTDQHNIGESWEISGVDGHESVVAEGDDKGLNLRQIIEKYKGDLVGNAVYAKYGDTFPLLVKIIDAKGDLSVQVHPDDTLAKARHNSYGKTEMWYIIDAEEGAPIYAGLSKQITPEEYEKLVAENAIMDVIARHDSHAGDLFFLPAGRIHAIGAGNLLAEIQQTSDITYRVYDFDRRDANGNPRELHTEQAKDAIDYTVYPEYKSEYDRNGKSATPLVKCQYFDVKREIIDGVSTIDASTDSFMIIMCLDGEATITDNLGGVTHVKKGESILVPAVITSMKAEGKATFMTSTV
ncbi:MAG: mannose-6-phosphate isomerase [bacterium]|nr:mannose-6-phosphate isomerase [bacterium]MDD6025217.1 mannose-6-phosphate isomerase [bacterium]